MNISPATVISIFSIILSILSVLMALLFGLSTFLNNLLGKAPSMNMVRNLFPTNPIDTSINMINSGTGPAIVMSITVIYHNKTTGVKVSEEATHAVWFKHLWLNVIEAHTATKLPPLQYFQNPPPVYTFWVNGSMVIGPSDSMSVLQIDRTDTTRHVELCEFLSHVDVEINYRSFFGTTYNNLLLYDPLGNTRPHSRIIKIYSWIANILGLTPD